MASGLVEIPRQTRSNTIYVDAIEGDDTTGRRGNANFPFQTLAAAASEYGDMLGAGEGSALIYVRRGNYSHSTNLAKSYKSAFSAASRTSNISTFTDAHGLEVNDIVRTREFGTASFNDRLRVATAPAGSFTAFNYGSNGSSSSGGFALRPLNWYFEDGCIVRNTMTSSATFDDVTIGDVWVRVRGGATFYMDGAQWVNSIAGASSIFDIECNAVRSDNSNAAARPMIKTASTCTSILNIRAREEFNQQNSDIAHLIGCEYAHIRCPRWITNAGSSADCVEEIATGTVLIEGDYFECGSGAFVINMTADNATGAQFFFRGRYVNGPCWLSNSNVNFVSADYMNGTVSFRDNLGPYDRGTTIRGATIAGSTNTAAIDCPSLSGNSKPLLKLLNCVLLKNGSATESISSADACSVLFAGCAANAAKSSNVTAIGTLSVDSNLVL